MTNTEISLTPTATLFDLAPYENIKGKSNIACRSWGTASASNVGIVLIHGLGAHSGWFEALSRRLEIRSIFVLSYDLVGFGKQKNERYLSYHQWLEETASVFAHMRSLMTDKPIFLLGNSMGALVALASRQLIKPSGLALLSPSFGGHRKIFSLSYKLPQLFKALAHPDREFKLPYGTDSIAKLEQVRSWLDQDSAFRQNVPGKMLLDLLLLTQSLRWQKIKLDCPLFMLTAEMDALVDNQVNELIFQQIISPNKKKTLISGAAHDLTLDPAVDEVADLLVNWMNFLIKEKELAII